MVRDPEDDREWHHTILLLGQTAISVDGELTRFTAAELSENPARALPANEPSWLQKNDTYIELDAEGRDAFVALLTGDRRCTQAVLNRLCRAEADRIVRDLAAVWTNRTRSARCLEGLAGVVGDSDPAMSAELRAIANGLREADRWVDDSARGDIGEHVVRALVDVREDLTAWANGAIPETSDAFHLIDAVSNQRSLLAAYWSSAVPTRMVRRSDDGFRLLTVGDVIREYATTRCKREFASAEEWIEYCRQHR